MPWVVAWCGPAAPAARCCAARTRATSGNNAPHHRQPANWTSAASGRGTRKMSWSCPADPATNPASTGPRMAVAAGTCCSPTRMRAAFGMGSSLPTHNTESSTVIQCRTPDVFILCSHAHDAGRGDHVDPAPKSPQPIPGESLFAASNSAMAAYERGWFWLGTSKGRVLRDSAMSDWQSAQTPLASGNDSSGVFSLAFRDQKHGIAVGGDYRKAGGGRWHRGFYLRRWRALERAPQTTPWVSFCRGLGRKRQSLDHSGQQWIRYLLRRW